MFLHVVEPAPLPPLSPRMAQDWVMPVIADLAHFAATNHLPVLAADLERCLKTAADELGQSPP